MCIDFSNAQLFVDGCHGIYVPQSFALRVSREYVENVSAEEWSILETGPDHEHYWDVWTNVELNAVIRHPNGRTYHLHQDGDLWLIPDDDTQDHDDA